MKIAVWFLVFLLTLLLVLTISPLSCSTTHLIVFFTSSFVIFNSSLSTGIFPRDWKNFKYRTYLNQKSLLHPLQTIPQSLLSLPSKILECHIFNYLYDFFLFTTSFLIVSWVSNQDSQLKQLYYLLSILRFLHWVSKMQSVQFSLISLKHLTLSLTSPYSTPYLCFTFLLFFCLVP